MRSLLHAALILVLVAGASFAADKPAPVLGDYDAELRLPSGHVDNQLLLQRLQDMHANTYYYLIWHRPTDWEDLQAFLPLARQAGIQVWAYLCPPSESGGNMPYSEPFRLDYARWGQEIGKLSLQYPNLVGWVIDDFWTNLKPGVFSSDTVREFVKAGKDANPRLRFYPLLYYPEIDDRFTGMLSGVVDGVVAAYPADKADIERAVAVLDDAQTIPSACWTVFPPATISKPGDFASLSQSAKVTNPNGATISFHYQDDFEGGTEGYHFMQLRVDDQVVWSEDVAGHDDKTVLLNLRDFVGQKPTVKVTLGVWDLKGVSQFGVRVAFSQLKVEGLEMHNTDLGYEPGWLLDSSGAFYMQCRVERKPMHLFHIPLIVMPCGDRSEYKQRYKDEPTPEHIAARTREALELMKAGKVEGVVMYCLDKKPGSADLEAIGKLYQEFQP